MAKTPMGKIINNANESLGKKLAVF